MLGKNRLLRPVLCIVIAPPGSDQFTMPNPLLSSLLALATAASLAAQAQPDPSLFEGLDYRCVGPSRGGRATTVAGVTQRPGEFYMGCSGGGLWKTTDFGINWNNVSDGYFSTPSIGAIRVAPSDPDIIYVGTGSDGLRSNVITGRGIYRSADAGKTWTFLGLRDTGQIGAVEVHPTDPDTVYVAAIGQAFQANPERGIYVTQNGGKTWKHRLFISDQVGIVDLELHPTDPSILYACSWRAERKPWTIISGAEGCGLYKSTDTGKSWRKLKKGLPQGLVGKSDLAVSKSDSKRVYALIEAPGDDGGLYRSDDCGESFRLVTNNRSLLDRPFYYCNIDADPTNADKLFASATGSWQSNDGGKKWRRMRTPHGDNHELWIHPERPQLMIQCNDGGANVTLDGGKTWSTQQNQMTAELYQVAVDDRFPYWLYGGQQDNSTIRVPSLPPYPSASGALGYWESVGGCETGPAIPKPGDPDIVYSNCKGRFGRFNARTGQEKQFYVGAANLYGTNPKDLRYRFQRVAPIAISPHNPDVVYHASQFLHRSTDEGQTWETISPDLTAFEADKQVISGSPITRDITGEEYYSTIYAVKESTIAKDVIWVGANDGPIHVTRDGGKTWRNVTPKGMPSGGRVQTVEPSPHKQGKAYVAILRYQLGDWQPHVYRTKNYGSTWERIADGKRGVPIDSPTRVIREDPSQEGLLYLGTEFGMFISFDDGKHWQAFQRNLPIVPVTDIVIHRDDLVLSTMGRSFWILDDIARLRQLTDSRSSVHLFTPRPAYRTRHSGGRGRGPSYPSAAANIDYWLKSNSKKLTLEILSSDGSVLRTISSRGKPRSTQSGSPMRQGRSRTSTRGLSSKAGAHRYRWDLRRGGGRRGPLVTPGSYKLRLTADDKSVTTEVQVRIDPRVAADGVTLDDLRAQEALCLEVADLAERASKLRSKVSKALKKNDDNSKLKAIQSRLVTAKGRYPQPMLIAQISYLSSMINRADQRPGRDAYERCAELTAQLKDLAAAFEKAK